MCRHRIPFNRNVVLPSLFLLLLLLLLLVVIPSTILWGDSHRIIMTIVERHLWERCRFLPENEGPLPVVLLSLGRSGSSVTWDTLSRLTGPHPTVAYEATGQTRFDSAEFFARMDPAVGARWASLRLCAIQRRHPRDAGIVGFQWKPYRRTFRSGYAAGALEEMAGRRDPVVRVVYLKRNALDRKVSNMRRHRGELPAHCRVGDVGCVERHKREGQNVTLPIGGELLKWLRTYRVTDRMVRDQLSTSGIRHISIEYEKLYLSDGDTADEWMRVFAFLGRGPATNLTMDDVRAHFSMEPTTLKHRREIISNYDQVEETLVNTEFHYLLNT